MTANKRVAKAWRYLAQKAFNWKHKVHTQEETQGDSDYLLNLLANINALVYLTLIYARITNELEELKTWEEYKDLYSYDTYKKLFAKYSIDLDTVANDYFKFEEIIDNDGVDDSELIFETDTVRNYVCGCSTITAGLSAAYEIAPES